MCVCVRKHNQSKNSETVRGGGPIVSHCRSRRNSRHPLASPFRSILISGVHFSHVKFFLQVSKRVSLSSCFSAVLSREPIVPTALHIHNPWKLKFMCSLVYVVAYWGSVFVLQRKRNKKRENLIIVRVSYKWWFLFNLYQPPRRFCGVLLFRFGFSSIGLGGSGEKQRGNSEIKYFVPTPWNNSRRWFCGSFMCVTRSITADIAERTDR